MLSTYTYTYICIYTHTYSRVHIYVYIHVLWGSHPRTRSIMNIHIYVCVHRSKYVYTYTYMYTHIDFFSYLLAYSHGAHIYIYMYTHIFRVSYSLTYSHRGHISHLLQPCIRSMSQYAEQNTFCVYRLTRTLHGECVLESERLMSVCVYGDIGILLHTHACSLTQATILSLSSAFAHTRTFSSLPHTHSSTLSPSLLARIDFLSLPYSRAAMYRLHREICQLVRIAATYTYTRLE